MAWKMWVVLMSAWPNPAPDQCNLFCLLHNYLLSYVSAKSHSPTYVSALVLLLARTMLDQSVSRRPVWWARRSVILAVKLWNCVCAHTSELLSLPAQGKGTWLPVFVLKVGPVCRCCRKHCCGSLCDLPWQCPLACVSGSSAPLC